MGQHRATAIELLEGVEDLGDDLLGETLIIGVFVFDIVLELVIGCGVVLVVGVELDFCGLVDVGGVVEEGLEGLYKLVDCPSGQSIRVVFLLISLIYKYRYFFIELILGITFHAF
jgi:hypothetical protein